MTRNEKMLGRLEAYKQLVDLLPRMVELDMHVASAMKIIEKAEEQLCGCEELPVEGAAHAEPCYLAGLSSSDQIKEHLISLGESGLRPPKDAIEQLAWQLRDKEKLERLRAEYEIERGVL